MIVGLTGHIATGKSTVARDLARRGAIVIDADQLAREVVRPGSPVLARVVDRFGAVVLSASGELDREALGNIVFRDRAALGDLNDIMHPAIGELASKRLRQAAQRQDIPLVVYDAPLLYEVGADRQVDKVLLVTCDPREQLQRLMARNGYDRTAAQRRIAAQSGLAEKIRKADYVIDNSGSEEELRLQLDRIWQDLVGAS